MIPQRPIEELLKLPIYTDLSDAELESVVAWNVTEVTRLKQDVGVEQDKAKDPKDVDYIDGVKKKYKRAVFVEESAAMIQMAILDRRKNKPHVSSDAEKARDFMLEQSRSVQGLASPLRGGLLEALNEYRHEFPNEKKSILKNTLQIGNSAAIPIALMNFANNNTAYLPVQWFVVCFCMLATFSCLEHDVVAAGMKRAGKTLVCHSSAVAREQAQEPIMRSHGWSKYYCCP